MGMIAAPIAMVATAIGSGVQAYGQKELGAYQQQMYNYQAGANTALAGAQEQTAQAIRQSGEVQAQQIGMQYRAERGRQVASTAAAGVDPFSGTARNVTQSITALGQESQALARTRAAENAYQEQLGAWGKRTEAGLETAAGKQAVVAGDIGALGSVVSGAGSVAKQWYQYGGTGGFDPGNLFGTG
jgi:hypothetical protein